VKAKSVTSELEGRTQGAPGGSDAAVTRMLGDGGRSSCLKARKFIIK